MVTSLVSTLAELRLAQGEITAVAAADEASQWFRQALGSVGESIRRGAAPPGRCSPRRRRRNDITGIA